MSVPSNDRLPIGDWSYDAMSSLAADDLVPGCSARVFQGDRLLNRMEMARTIASVAASSAEKQLTPQQSALLDKLISEFKPELAVVDPSVAENWGSSALPFIGTRAFLMGQAIGYSGENSGNDSSIRLSGFADLSDRTFSMVTYSDKRLGFFRETREGEDPDKFFMQGIDGNFRWSVGREYLNWGPSYLGSLVISDNSGGFLQLRGAREVDFGKFLGRVKITGFASTFHDDGKTLYLIGRRYQKPLSGRVFAGVNEVAKMNTEPNPLIMIMPIYLYQELFVRDVDTKVNAVYSADLVYRTKSGKELYGEWMVDDISAPKVIFPDRYRRPRKTGLTLGYYLPQVFSGKRLSTLRAEYTYVDRLTYTATRDAVPELAYTHDSDIIGHPIGPNSEALYLRGEQYLSDRFSVIAEYLDQKQKEPGPPDTAERRVLSVLAAYDISPDKSIGLRIAPYKIARPGTPVEDSTLYEVRASIAF